MRTMISFAAVGLLCTSMAFSASAPPPSDEAALERKFDTLIQPNDLRDWMKLLAAEPNHVGSPHDKANAEQILTWFKNWGWDANIETFWVLYPTPINESLELVRSKPFKATLQEPPISGDSSATATEPALPAYVEYQGDGVNTGVKVHQRIAVKIHQPEEDGSGVWPLEGGARGGLPPRRVIEDLI